MTDATVAQSPLWIVEEDVRRLVSLNDVIDALSSCLKLEARGHARNVDKALGQWDSSSMHSLGSMMPGRGYVAYKTWANTPKGAAAVVSLFSSTDGRLLALMEASAIGGMRTAAISGVATNLLADPKADEMALIGTGVQAVMQIAAVSAVRQLNRVNVFSPTPEKRAAFVKRVAPMFPFPIEEERSIEEAVRNASIVTTITRAKAPFLSAGMLGPATHVNAPGAILPDNAELEQDMFLAADLVVVDSKSGAAKGSKELIDHYGSDLSGWSDVHTLGELLSDGGARPANARLTIFKSMGMGLADLAVAILAYERALEQGCGLKLPEGRRAPPRFTPLSAAAVS